MELTSDVPPPVTDSDTEAKYELTKGQKVTMNISDDTRPQIVEVEIIDITEGFIQRVQFKYDDWNGPVTTSFTLDEFMERMISSSRVARALKAIDATTKKPPETQRLNTTAFLDGLKNRFKRPSRTYVPYPREDANSPEEEAEQDKQMDIFANELYEALKRLATDDPALIQRWASMDYMPGLLDQVLQTLKNKYNIIINLPSPQLHDELDEAVKITIQEFAAGRNT